MNEKTMGFIGAGRVTRIILQSLKNAGRLSANTVVSDIGDDALKLTLSQFPGIRSAGSDNTVPAGQELVFVSLHAHTLAAPLEAVAASLSPKSIVISLAPKVSTAQLSSILGGFNRIVRMIPNAPSVVNSGYNPVVYSSALSETEKQELKSLFAVLGDVPEVPENDLEAYAILCAMGPTYFWFQFRELVDIAATFGLTKPAAEQAIEKMLTGAVKTFFHSGLTPEQVFDLVPLRPLSDQEAAIRETYRTKLDGVFKKLKG